jgi:hypothetical protein
MRGKRTSEEVRQQILDEPDTMKYAEITRKYGVSYATVNAVRGRRHPRGSGHKPKGKSHHRLSPGTSLAKRGEVVEIDPPAEESVTCEVPVSKLDAIHELLTPYQRAIAVLSGVGEVEPEA